MKERLKYTNCTKPVDTKPPKVDVCMIQVRPDDHAWVQEAKQSVSEQVYANLGFLVVDNQDRALSIGSAWNACVEDSDADLLLFLGDDDGMTVDLVSAMVYGYQHMKAKAPNLVHISTNCTILDESSGSVGMAPVQHTGMFLREFLVDHPFDELLARHVGLNKVQAIAQASKAIDQPMSTGIMHHYGYIWRQHMFMNNGRPIRLDHGKR